MANINTKQVYSQVEKMGPDLKSTKKLQDKVPVEKGLFAENTSPHAGHPNSAPSCKEIPNPKEKLNNVESDANSADSEKTIDPESNNRQSNTGNILTRVLGFILKPIAPIRAKVIALNLTLAYSTKKIIALSISLLTVTAICVIGIALVSEFFIIAMLTFWLASLLGLLKTLVSKLIWLRSPINSEIPFVPYLYLGYQTMLSLMTFKYVYNFFSM